MDPIAPWQGSPEAAARKAVEVAERWRTAQHRHARRSRRRSSARTPQGRSVDPAAGADEALTAPMNLNDCSAIFDPWSALSAASTNPSGSSPSEQAALSRIEIVSGLVSARVRLPGRLRIVLGGSAFGGLGHSPSSAPSSAVGARRNAIRADSEAEAALGAIRSNPREDPCGRG
jgi:hypothetical protein